MSSAATQAQGRPRPEAVVIGGSAGALDALIPMLAALPAGLAPPIVVVLHLARRRPSRLAEILHARTGRDVREPQDKEPLASRTVYVAPPDYHLLLDEGPRLALSIDEPVNYSLPSIDVLFQSAADVLGPRVAGVLLSGANADGARGLRAIADAGGHAMIQAPGEAASAAMPEAGIQMCPTAEVLTLRGMCERLRDLAGDGGSP